MPSNGVHVQHLAEVAADDAAVGTDFLDACGWFPSDQPTGWYKLGIIGWQ